MSLPAGPLVITRESTLAMAAAMQPLAHHDGEHQRRIAKWRSS